MLGHYRLAALSPDVVADYRDARLNTVSERTGGLSHTTVRLELAFLGHLFAVARREWGLGLVINPVHLITSPPYAPGCTRRLRVITGSGYNSAPGHFIYKAGRQSNAQGLSLQALTASPDSQITLP